MTHYSYASRTDTTHTRRHPPPHKGTNKPTWIHGFNLALLAITAITQLTMSLQTAGHPLNPPTPQFSMFLSPSPSHKSKGGNHSKRKHNYKGKGRKHYKNEQPDYNDSRKVKGSIPTHTSFNGDSFMPTLNVYTPISNSPMLQKDYRQLETHLTTT